MGWRTLAKKKPDGANSIGNYDPKDTGFGSILDARFLHAPSQIELGLGVTFFLA